MIIHYKGIWHERCEDAPFIGALISAVDCKFNCKECFNQHIKDYNTLTSDSTDIIKQVKSNKFNEGVIFAGLEWTLQSIELEYLIKECLNNNLKVILYTGLIENTFKQKFKQIYDLPIYIKFGQYKEKLKTDNYYMYGVKLASKNQIIRNNTGVDYESRSK
jgi:pyruvate-formate lyase-activating enzyme